MESTKSINEIIHWKAKFNIILTQHMRKEMPLSKKIINNYNRDIGTFSEAPTDKDVITEYLIQEKLLKKITTEDGQIIKITEQGIYAIKNGAFRSETIESCDMDLTKLATILAIFIPIYMYLLEKLEIWFNM